MRRRNRIPVRGQVFVGKAFDEIVGQLGNRENEGDGNARVRNVNGMFEARQLGRR
jgi:hypothetical protein